MTPERLTVALADRYRIERELGQGGMATVYLAEDLKHKRHVALKVLKPELAAVLGAERFVQEITTTAALQHPHILPLFDSGTADGFLYYVMPYIEGETLRTRLDRETQLGIDEAVKITTEVADALDYAHRHGVIHRDIKPENILLHDGRPMVADFGIALALSAAAGGRMTETGMSLGTPHYMSPEQATAEKELTNRSDIYSLGSVLYEMLTGNPPHVGASAQQIIMKIVTEEAAPVTKLRKSVPPNIVAAVAKALEKLPADRFESAKAFGDALGNPGYASSVTMGSAIPMAAERSSAATRTTAMAAVILLLAVVAGWALLRPASGADQAPVRHWNIVLPDSAPLDFFAASVYGEGQPALAISRGGDRIAYVARHRGGSSLYVRQLDEASSLPLAGTDGASQPFFSPDGEWVGFFADGNLKKVAISGGAPLTLTRAGAARGAVWTTSGQILFADQNAASGNVMVSAAASGGIPSKLPQPEDRVFWPSLLPGERWVVGSSPSRKLVLWSPADGRQLAISDTGPVPMQSAGSTNLLTGTFPRYAASGHLLYLVGNTLMALPFDAGRLRVLGPPVPVVQEVRRESWYGAGQYDIAADGTLLFAHGADAARSVLVWVDRTGRVTDTLKVPPGDYFNIFASPDGRRIAFASNQATGEQTQLILDVGRGLIQEVRPEVPTVFTAWWPDGEQAVLYVGRREREGIAWRAPIGGAGARDSLQGPGWEIEDVTRDLQYMSLRGRGDSAGTWLISLDGSQRQLVDVTGWWGVFSPDGRWIACSSNDGIKVSAVPSTGSSQLVATGGPDEPEWSPRGDELFYRAGNRWMAVAVSTRGGFSAGTPRELFRGRYLNVTAKSYDIGPDGRFLLLLGPPEETAGYLDVVTGFRAELDRLAPSGEK